MNRKLNVFTLVIVSLFVFAAFAAAQTGERAAVPKEKQETEKAEKFKAAIKKVRAGTTKEELYSIFSDFQGRAYESRGNEEWVVFMNWMTDEPGDLIIFYLKDGKVKGWNVKKPRRAEIS